MPTSQRKKVAEKIKDDDDDDRGIRWAFLPLQGEKQTNKKKKENEDSRQSRDSKPSMPGSHILETTLHFVLYALRQDKTLSLSSIFGGMCVSVQGHCARFQVNFARRRRRRSKRDDDCSHREKTTEWRRKTRARKALLSQQLISSIACCMLLYIDDGGDGNIRKT